MTRMTSSCANKALRKLKEDRAYWCNRENEGCFYVAAVDEEPVIPEYDYAEVADKIAEIDKKVIIIKHAININNVINRIQVGDDEMTIDEILVKMAQLNNRKALLDYLRKQEPKKRISATGYASRKSVAEYKYINYDLEMVKEEYEFVDAQISQMQIALDKYNQTVEFDVDI